MPQRGASQRRTNYYRKAGYHVHEESGDDGRGSGLSHTSGDPHCRDQGAHQQYHGDPNHRNDPDTPLEYDVPVPGELVDDSSLQIAQQLGCYMAVVAGLYNISHQHMLPLLQVSRHCGFDVAACALPDCQADGKLNLNKFWVAGYSTSSRLRNRVNRNPSWNLPQFPTEKWDLTYLGPGGLARVFELP